MTFVLQEGSRTSRIVALIQAGHVTLSDIVSHMSGVDNKEIASQLSKLATRGVVVRDGKCRGIKYHGVVTQWRLTTALEREAFAKQANAKGFRQPRRRTVNAVGRLLEPYQVSPLIGPASHPIGPRGEVYVTAAFCGDPPPGRSALAQRIARAAE